MNEIRYFSMFTGVGGFELGLEKCSHKNEEICRDPSEIRSEEGQCSEPANNSPKRFTCVGMSEWDKYSSQVLRYKFPNIKNWGDCTKINPSELPDFDMLCGGFPCQAFSIAGKRRGFEDTRGTMFFEVARILKIKRPKIVLLENVKGLLNHNKGQTFSVILETLDELGYETQWMVLNSKFFGVPQNRERVFIIGNLRGASRSQILPIRENDSTFNEKNPEVCQCVQATGYKGGKGTHVQVEGMLTDGGWDKRHENIRRVDNPEGISPTIPTGQGGGVMPKIKTIGRISKGMSGQVYSQDGISPTIKGEGGGLGAKTGLYEIRAVLTPDRAKKRQAGRRFKESGEPSFTITGQDIHGITNGKSIRRLTPTECERLQGFPDGWTEFGLTDNNILVKMSDTQRYKQMGNAVTVNVIKAIGERL